MTITTARKAATALAVAVTTLTVGVGAAQAAAPASHGVPSARGLQRVAPAKAPASAPRHRARHRPPIGKPRRNRSLILLGGSGVSYSELVGCFGPFVHAWGYSRTCVWDGKDLFGDFMRREYHYQYWNGFTYRPWYTVFCDASGCAVV
jgi:hypothetical protein